MQITASAYSVSDLSARLQRLSDLARQFACDRLAAEATDLAARLSEGRFYVVCIGQFKRGKSTLLNALVHDPILPTGIVPVTAVPTVLRYGAYRSVRLRFREADWIEVPPEQLLHYVCEEHNPENVKAVAAVEVFIPSPLLARGLCLVDTPGLGSIFAGNTAATQAFVPQIDAALIVVGCDPPIAREELALAEEVAKHVNHLLVVLNKADRATESERSTAESFTRGVLETKLGRAIGPIFEVSAAQQLAGNANAWDWQLLAESLRNLEENSGRDLVHAAGGRGLQRLGEELLSVAWEEREALLRPIEESERRIAAMRQTITESDRSLRDLAYLLMAEKHRLSDLFLERRKKFLQQNLASAKQEAAEAFRNVPAWYGPKFRREAMRAAQAIAASCVLPWLEKEQSFAEQEYRAVAARFVEIANSFLKKLAQSQIPELSRMLHALDPEKGFRAASHFRFERLINVAQPASPLRYAADVVLGSVRAASIIRSQALEFCEHLLEMNSTRVQSDLVDRVDSSQSQLEAEIRKLLQEVTRVAAAALDHARQAKALGTAAVEEKLKAIAVAENGIQAILRT